MKIKTISATKTFGNYQNISMTAEVEENETIDDSFDALNAIISNEIKRQGHYSEVQSDIHCLESNKLRLEAEVETLNARRTALVEFLNKHGVQTNIDDNFLPF